MDTFIEYRVRPVTRYIVTRFEKEGGEHIAPSARNIGSVGSVGNGEFDNADTAYAVAYALARADHERLGYALDDPRIRYPEHPRDQLAQGAATQVADLAKKTTPYWELKASEMLAAASDRRNELGSSASGAGSEQPIARAYRDAGEGWR